MYRKVQPSSSLNDVQIKISDQLSKSFNSVKSLFGGLRAGAMGQNQHDGVVKSQSSCTMNNTPSELKWPVLVKDKNEQQWVSSSSLCAANHFKADAGSDSDSDTVYQNPTHSVSTSARDANGDNTESLISKFDHVLATGKSSRQVSICCLISIFS